MATKTRKKTRVKLNINREFILLENNLVDLPSGSGEISKSFVATVVSNLAYYGYILSKSAFDKICLADGESIKSWWERLEPVLKEYTGDSKNMSSFVVYKNFPREVLDKTESEYWFAQILMYWGVSKDNFTESEKSRENMLENIELKVLSETKEDSVQSILNSLFKSPTKWTPNQERFVLFILRNEDVLFDVSKITFKENMVFIISRLLESDIEVNMKSATDVLRLAVGMSEGDVSLNLNSRFRKFKRSERQFLLGLLENSTNLAEDMMRYKGKWKRFMYSLHPGDYSNKYPGVCEAYNALYNGKIRTFNSEVELGIKNGDVSVLGLLKTRPGEFVRRLNKTCQVFGVNAVEAFSEIIDKLSVSQLLKIEKYLENANVKVYRTIAPKGNWNKLQILENNFKMKEIHRASLLELIRNRVAEVVSELHPEVRLNDSVKNVKIQTNGSELAPYGIGTVFPIPKNIKFIRAASYWEDKGFGNTWFDNGWNFFGENWEVIGTLDWTQNNFAGGSAIFSGDPTNSTEMDGKACQLIDLYLDKLEGQGVRYAVWNVLCYSGVKFSNATDVFAALQWGEEAQKGKLFEPSRCQLAFPLEGDSLTKYIAYIDIKKRELVYMDANFRGSVSAARYNESYLSSVMPAFCEYLDTIPSVYDVFKGVDKSDKGTVITYDDSNVELKGDEDAYVFKPVNESNNFKQLDINSIL